MSGLRAIWERFIAHQAVDRVVYFFPIRLFLLHLRDNHVLLFFWVFLGGLITGSFGTGYGVPYLFWDPEYMGKVDFWSFLILGFSFGGFMMAFNISSYILNATKFPFLATLNRPFLKYSLNNFIIPGIFIVAYLYKMTKFQVSNEFFLETNKLKTGTVVFYDVLGFVLGAAMFSAIGHTYFAATTRNVFKLFGLQIENETHLKAKRPMARPIKVFFEKNLSFRRASEAITAHDEWKVSTYLVNPIRVALTRDTTHYDRGMLAKVFDQNHLMATFFVILIFVSFIALGAFREIPQLTIPAGAVIFLACTFLLMLTSALHSRLGVWSTTGLIAAFIAFHQIVGHGYLEYRSKAYGLSYDGVPAPYTIDTISALNTDKGALQRDIAHHQQILGKWRQQLVKKPWDKPKLLLICVTGGGSRSAMWTFRTLQYADEKLNGRLLRHAHMITGASGGMYGATYLREMYLQSLTDKSVNLYDTTLADNIAKDLLNPVATSLALNDIFIRYQTFKDGPNRYTKDRGFALERELNINTGGVLEKRLRDYFKPEVEAQIPIVAMNPIIIDDGRMLIIGSQPLAHLTYAGAEQFGGTPVHGSVEFKRLFSAQGADRLWFSSALRMNSSFPYILPAVTLPSNPEIEVMDAGFYDTYGIIVATRHLYHLREWINANTSGVVILQVRDTDKVVPFRKLKGKSLTSMITDPVGNIYANMFDMQDFDNDQMLTLARQFITGSFDVVDLELDRFSTQSISLSWHLTTKEKMMVRASAYRAKNEAAIARLDSLLR